MINLTDVVSQLPINIYVVLGCCVFGWIMKKFLPTDNKYIPLTLTIIGAVSFSLLEGLNIENIILGAFTGAASTGLHQAFTQLIEGKKIDGDVEVEELNEELSEVE